MGNLSDFHRCASELLRCIGFDIPPPAADQDIISLSVDQRFTIHLGSIDDDYWFMQSDLDVSVLDSRSALLARALHSNQLATRPWQPVVALDAENRLVSWLRLPIRGGDLPAHVAAFDAIIENTEQLLANADIAATPSYLSR